MFQWLIRVVCAFCSMHRWQLRPFFMRGELIALFLWGISGRHRCFEWAAQIHPGWIGYTAQCCKLNFRDIKLDT